jgi:hypothetical protein
VRQRLLELEIRGRVLAADLASGLLSRARSARGQTTVEWIALMVGFTALATVLAGNEVWSKAGELIVNAVNSILSTANDKV